MMFMILGVGLFLLPILFRLALKLRLGIPMLYAVLMLTAFHGWYQAHTALADGIFFGLAALAAHFDAARAFYPWQPSQRPQSGKSFGS